MHRSVNVRTLGALMLAVAAAMLFHVGPAFGDACEALWLRHVTRGVRNADAATKEQAARWVRTFRKTDDEIVRRGMLQSLFHKELNGLVASVRMLNPRDIPFPGSIDDRMKEVYRIIGELSGPQLDGVPGLSGKIGDIFGNAPSVQKGSLLDLRVADDIGLAGQRGVAGAGFEITQSAGGVSRRYDVADGLNGIVHENKNWPTGLPEFPTALPDFYDEFRRDIIIHGRDNFIRYRINFREATRTHLGMLKTELLKQFDDDSVKTALGGDWQRVRDEFERLWDAADNERLLSFY